VSIRKTYSDGMASRSLEASLEGGILSVVIDGEPHQFELFDRAGSRSLRRDGRVERFVWARNDHELWIQVSGRVLVLTESVGRPRKGVETGGLGPIEAPMTGTVRKVLVIEGSEVAAGQSLVVVEAMKMEHAVRAPDRALVASIRCKEGETCEQGSVLLVLEPASEETAR
jgi:biotin carboxyl carrier protein